MHTKAAGCHMQLCGAVCGQEQLTEMQYTATNSHRANCTRPPGTHALPALNSHDGQNSLKL
jgi:hypothetical protein